MKGFCPLASGSKGNCIYVGTGQTKILIDAGLSLRALKERLDLIGVDISEIDAIVLTHEHIDHIKGIETLGCKLGIPILANSDTARAVYEILGQVPKFKIFSTGEAFEYGDIELHPFSIQHDAVDPVAFTLHVGGLKLGVCADLGFATTLVKHQLASCDMLYIESNHQTSMVHACSRPASYKQRVLSRQGHLSNDQCGELLAAIVHNKLQQVYLAHLSSECNVPEVALKVVSEAIGRNDLTLTIAHQEKVSVPFLF